MACFKFRAHHEAILARFSTFTLYLDLFFFFPQKEGGVHRMIVLRSPIQLNVQTTKDASLYTLLESRVYHKQKEQRKILSI